MDDGSLVLIRHKLDADNYYCMAEIGILGRRDRVELIEGEIIDMAPIGQGHVSTVGRLMKALILACGDEATVLSQSSLRLDSLNVPEPDFAILKYRDDFYGAGSAAGPADVLLLIEVSDSSLQYDRAVKLALYARSGIPEVWIVDVNRRVVETYCSPEGSSYTVSSVHTSGDILFIQTTPTITIQVIQVLGA